MMNMLMPGQTPGAKGTWCELKPGFLPPSMKLTQAQTVERLMRVGIWMFYGDSDTDSNATPSATPTFGSPGMPAHPRARTAHMGRTCGNCGAENGPANRNGRLLKCGGCKRAVYCGKEW